VKESKRLTCPIVETWFTFPMQNIGMLCNTWFIIWEFVTEILAVVAPTASGGKCISRQFISISKIRWKVKARLQCSRSSSVPCVHFSWACVLVSQEVTKRNPVPRSRSGLPCHWGTRTRRPGPRDWGWMQSCQLLAKNRHYGYKMQRSENRMVWVTMNWTSLAEPSKIGCG
jgi:hypothetical protein